MERIFWSMVLAAVIAGGCVGLWLFGVIGLIFAFPVALVVAVFAGAPAFFLLRKLGWLSWWQLTVTGALLVTPIAVCALPNWGTVGIMAASGAAGGLLFWCFGIGPNYLSKPTANAAA